MNGRPLVAARERFIAKDAVAIYAYVDAAGSTYAKAARIAETTILDRIMIDLLYLSWNRREFTEASLNALRENTDWSLVNSIWFYDDCSVDGARSTVCRFSLEFPFHPLYIEILRSFGSPVAVMKAFIKESSEVRTNSDIFCKLDNDVIVPPGWLNESLAVMEAHPEIDLLGIEPGVGPDPNFTRAATIPLGPVVRGILPCDFIGGIGLMRRRVFDGRYGLPEPAGQRYGFTEWQERNPQIKKAWIAPGLPVVLLNRMPTEPWATLSREYVAKGWQRDWPGPYREDERATWEWWIRGE